MHLVPRTLLLILALLVPATAASAAPPPNDAPLGAGAFGAYTTRVGAPTELAATAELVEATADPGVPSCLGRDSFARTVWYRIPAGPTPRELRIEAGGRTLDVVDLAVFVQPATASAPVTVRPNACAGSGLGAGDAAEDRMSAVTVRIPPHRSVLLQVGRRGGVLSPDDERVQLTLADTVLPSTRAPRGDRAGRATPKLPRRGRERVALSGATTSEEDPASPACPTLGGVWRQLKPRASGRYTVIAEGAEAAALTVFSGASPSDRTFLGCTDRDGAGPMTLPVRLKRNRRVWVRIGTDRPSGRSRARLTVRRSRAGDVESGGGCLASARPRVGGRPAGGEALTVRARNRTRSFPLVMKVHGGPVCDARLRLRGPGGVTYASAEVPALRGRGEIVVLRRNRRLRRGRYRLRVEAAGLAGARRAVPSSVSFRLR